MAVGGPCSICETTIPPYRGHHPNERLNRERRSCSKSCAIKLAHREGRWHLPNPPNSWGPSNTNWKGGVKLAGPYRMVKVPPGTPGRTRGGYMMEHRFVMQEHLGRPLLPTEEVHHRNGRKTDNRIKNLEIVAHADHRGTVLCPHCRKAFTVR